MLPVELKAREEWREQGNEEKKIKKGSKGKENRGEKEKAWKRRRRKEV
jgi:hypothetical protein